MMKPCIERELAEKLLEDEGFRICALELLNDLPSTQITTFDDLLDDIMLEIFVENNPVDN